LLGLGKLAHRFHLGLYREGESSLYVHPGLGTTGPPIRVGVAPEIAILTLRAA
jgi:predicted MPP superfamily phosphohydrolase